jgi:hypothetical protein
MSNVRKQEIPQPQQCDIYALKNEQNHQTADTPILKTTVF